MKRKFSGSLQPFHDEKEAILQNEMGFDICRQKKGLKGNEAIKWLYLGFREIVKRRDAASKRMQEKVELDVTYCNYKIYRFDKNFLVFRTKM